MPTIIPMPAELHRLATQAERERDHVHLSPDETRALANAWHDDHERVRYLESLLIRCARGGDFGAAVLTMPPMTREQRKHFAAMLLHGFGDDADGSAPV